MGEPGGVRAEDAARLGQGVVGLREVGAGLVIQGDEVLRGGRKLVVGEGDAVVKIIEAREEVGEIALLGSEVEIGHRRERVHELLVIFRRTE